MGHVKESVGTHGHMKCIFDRSLNSSDVVLMPLYKRIFPKWCYQPLVSGTAAFGRIQEKRSTGMDWIESTETLQLSRKQKQADTQRDAAVTINAEELALFD